MQRKSKNQHGPAVAAGFGVRPQTGIHYTQAGSVKEAGKVRPWSANNTVIVSFD
jgi:hypothetical protein